jgi:hypothetical protein
MNRKLVIGAVAGVAAVALAYGGTTYSAWSDFGDVTGNTTTAGVLVLNLGANKGEDLKFDNIKIAPGLNMERHVYIASNDAVSTPSAKLFVSLTNLKGHEDGCHGNGEIKADLLCNDTAGAGQFIEDATVQWSSYAVDSPTQCNQSYATAKNVITPQHGPTFQKLSNETATSGYELTGDYSANGGTALPLLAPGKGLCFAMEVGLWHGVDNASQGDSASFDLHFDLVQP